MQFRFQGPLISEKLQAQALENEVYGKLWRFILFFKYIETVIV